MLPVIYLLVGIFSRLIIHAPNFTPIVALALFGGIYLNKRLSIILPLVLFLITDLIIGAHSFLIFTWSSIALIAFIGQKARHNKKITSFLGAGILSVALFFVLTNFGYWLFSGTYLHTLEGFTACYINALPFLRNNLISTFLFGFILIGSYEAITILVKKTSFAKVLLTR